MCICKIRFLLCICVLCWKDKVMLKTQSDGKLPVIIFFHTSAVKQYFAPALQWRFFFSFFFFENYRAGPRRWPWLMGNERHVAMMREREREREREVGGKKVWECVLVVVQQQQQQQQQQGSLCFSPSALFFTSRISHSRHMKRQSTGVSLLWGLCAWEGECDTVGGEVNKNELRGNNWRRTLHCTERTDCTERD